MWKKTEGTISGEVICRGLFTVEREANARVRVQARDAHIQGRFEGDVVCTGRLLLSATAHVTGTMKAAVLVVEEGATVSGNVDTTQLRKLLLEAMEIPVTQSKREPTKTMKEAESEITVG